MSASQPKLYRPSNGTEGDAFMSVWCERCARFNNDDPDNTCMINLLSMVHDINDAEYPRQLVSINGIARCTAFQSEGDDLVEPRCPSTIDLFEGAN